MNKQVLTKTFSFSKWLLFFFFAVGLSLTSCEEDYDDDISNLKDQVAALKSSISDLESKIGKGQSISSVTSIANGIKITLSDGTSYDITNGKDGKDGEGSVLTIGENGNWFIDGKDSGKAAQGPAGPQGPAGSGSGGEGTNGKDGIYYYPGSVEGEYPFWVKIDPNLAETEAGYKTVTTTKWLGDGTSEGTVSAVIDANGIVTLTGVKDADGNLIEVKLSMNTGDLRSLVFVPQLVYEGTPAIEFATLKYFHLAADGTLPAANKEINKKNTPIAEYHMNPSSVKEDMIMTGKMAFAYENVKVITRAAGADVGITPVFEEIKDGILRAKVNVADNFKFAEKPMLDLVALQVPLATEDTIITSDYAALYESLYDKFDIAHTGKTGGTSKYPEAKPLDGEYFYHGTYKNGASAASDYTAVTYDQLLAAKADTLLLYNDAVGIDLTGIVKVAVRNDEGKWYEDDQDVWGNDGTIIAVGQTIDVDKLFGFTYKFEVFGFQVDNTKQEDFIDLKGTTITPKVFDTSGTAAIGRTPIIKVSLMDDNNPVKVSFIKVEIVGEITPPDETIGFEFGDINVSCEDVVKGLTVKQMNVQVYNKLGFSKQQFHDNYTFTPNDGAEGNVGTALEAQDPAGPETTHVVEWTLTPADLWANIGKTVEYKATYTKKTSSTVNGPSTVDVKFIAKIVSPLLKREQADLYTPFWDNGFVHFLQNVAVPEPVVYTSSVDCSFNNMLYSGFRTYTADNGTQRLGYLDFSKGSLASVYAANKALLDNLEVTYTFADKNAGTFTFGGKKYIVSLNDTKTELLVTTDSKVAPISVLRIVEEADPVNPVADPVSSTWAPANGGTQLIVVEHETAPNGDPDPNAIIKALISSNEFTAWIDTHAQGCDGELDAIAATGAYATFPVKYVRPVNAKSINNASFIDAVTGGSKVQLMDLLQLTDWRGKDFETELVNEEKHLYEYYGVVASNITIDYDKGVTISPADGVGNVSIVKPENIVLDSTTGEFIYKNDGSPISKLHKLTIPVKVAHKWGIIDLDIVADLKPSL